MKIIFLDIDGVLNVRSNEIDEFGHLFHKPFVDNLSFIIASTGAKIVISSSWRIAGLQTMQRMWEMRDLPGKVIDITPDCVQLQNDIQYLDMVERGHEIQYWLDRHKFDQYVIIDDDNDMLQPQSDNFVRTANNNKHQGNIFGLGLTTECAKMAIEILNKK